MLGTNKLTLKPLDQSSPTSLWRQLADQLSGFISSGTLLVGDPLPTEESICRDLGLSRATVRKAFSELVSLGLVTRRAGKGSFVAEPKLHRSLDTLYNFSSEMVALGIAPSSKVIRFRSVEATDGIAERLEVPDGTPAWEIRRLRMGDGMPILLETTYVPCRLCPVLDEDDLEESLYSRIAEESGSKPNEAREIYEAIALAKVDAELLECRPGSPAVRISRDARNARNEVFEASTIIAPGKRNKYELTLHQGSTTLMKLA